MRKAFLILFILVLGNVAFGQCLCGKLRFAVDDDANKYVYFVTIGEDKYRVKFHSLTNQSHINLDDSKKSFFIHHSYKTFDKKQDKIVTKTFDKKYFVLLDIDPGKRDFIIEIVNKKNRKKMEITITKNTTDVTYNVLTDFVPGKYKIDITAMKDAFYKSYKKKKIVFNNSELKAIGSDSKRSAGNDWIKIMDMEKFKDQP